MTELSTLTSICCSANPLQPNKVALIDAQTQHSLTYSQLYSSVQYCSTQLQSLLGQQIPSSKNATISLSISNSLHFVISFLAVTSLNYTCAPLNFNYTESENSDYLQDLRACAVVIIKCSAEKGNDTVIKAAQKLKLKIIEIEWNQHLKVFELNLLNTSPIPTHRSELVTFIPEPNSVALVLHTSGTTSKPKSVPLTQRNLAVNIENIVRTYSLATCDISLLVMPLFHVHGMIGVLFSTLSSYGTVVIPAKFSVTQFFKQLRQFNCTWYSAVPTIHQIILANQTSSGSSASTSAPFPSLRFIRSCSAALAPSILHQLEKFFKVQVLEAYAMTEASHQCTSNPPSKRKPGSVGIGQNVAVAIFNEKGQTVTTGQIAEVCVSGANVMNGYINNPQVNKTSFWPNPAHPDRPYFRTGDLGYLDEESYLYLTGRSKELINRAGEKISPLEIDAVLLEHAVVDQAIAFPLEHSTYGQEVYAAVVLKPSAQLKDISEQAITELLQRHCESRLSLFKVPKYIFIASELPKTSTGKVQRRFVSQVFQSKLPLQYKNQTVNQSSKLAAKL